MTILFLSHEDDKLMGSTLSLANMIHALQGLGCEVLVTLPGEGVAKEFFEKSGIRCIVAKYHVDFVGIQSKFKRYLSFPYRLIRDWHDHREAIDSIIRQLNGKRIDIVHTNTAVLDFGPTLAQRLGAPHIWHLREFIDLDMGYRPFRGWKRLRKMIQQADATISITRSIAQHYGVDSSEEPHRHYVMFDAVRSSQSLYHIEKKLPQMVFCGQLLPHKAPDVAIRVFCRFAEKHPEYQLLLMGTTWDSTYQESLHKMVPEIHKDKVQFMGYVDNPDEIIAKSAALLMCSHNEAQGRVTVEAMLQGCPVIGFDQGGTHEIIQHKVTGWLFTTEEQLLSYMEETVNNPEMTHRIAKAAEEFATEHFLEEKYGKSILSIYQKVHPL